MKHQDAFREEIRELSPLLDQLKDKSREFEVPDGYFENLTERLMQRVPEARRPFWESWVAWLNKLVQPLQPAYILAATVLILAIVGWNEWEGGLVETETCTELACLTSEEVATYIDANMEGFDMSTMLDAGDISELDPEYLDLPAETQELEEVFNEALESLDPAELDLLIN